MQSLADKLKQFPPIKKEKTKITNERQFIIKEFLERLNADRKPPYKPLTAGFVASKMSMLSLSQLKMFLGDCKYAKNFSKYWWWSINPKKHNATQERSVEASETPW